MDLLVNSKSFFCIICYNNIGDLMKKKILVLFIFVFMICGCGKNKVLKCNYADKKDFAQINTSQTFTFTNDGEKLKNFDVVIEYIYDEQYMTLLSSLGETLQGKVDTDSICESYKVHNGVSCITEVNDNKLTIKINGSVLKDNESYISGNYNSIKETYTRLNYTCK